MPYRCVVAACDNKAKRGKVTLHGIPLDETGEPDTRWVRFVQVWRAEWTPPSLTSQICSDHFLPSDYANYNMVKLGFAKNLGLLPGAVPTIQPSRDRLTERLQQNQKPKQNISKPTATCNSRSDHKYPKSRVKYVTSKFGVDLGKHFSKPTSCPSGQAEERHLLQPKRPSQRRSKAPRAGGGRRKVIQISSLIEDILTPDTTSYLHEKEEKFQCIKQEDTDSETEFHPIKQEERVMRGHINIENIKQEPADPESVSQAAVLEYFNEQDVS